MIVFSDIEQIVYNWLVKRHVVFEAQVSLRGGIFALGGARVDFIIEPNLAWRVHGEYWHTGVVKRGQDLMQKELLIADGYTVVDIWQDDIENNLNTTMEKALVGEEVLH